MSKLTSLLEYCDSNKQKKKSLLNSNKFITETGLNKEQRELLLSEAETETTLVNAAVLEAITNGANKRQIIRKALPIYKVNSYKARVPYSSVPTDYANEVGEGAAIQPIDGSYGSGSKEIKKFAVRAAVTNELIEDSEFHIVEHELERAGAMIENSLNKEGISVLLSEHNGTTPADVDPSGTHIAPGDLLLAKSKVVGQGYGHNFVVLTHPTSGSRYLYNDSALSNVFGGQTTVWGMEPYELSDATYETTTQKWDNNDAANHYYGLVFDKDNYAGILMRDDIHVVNEMEDPIHDLTNIIVSMRASVCVFADKAACRILTK